jgi:chromosome partitioning protein
MILSVQNQKGGGGKTATAVSLAAVAREAGRRVLLVDLDPQASATRWLGSVPEVGLSDVLGGEAPTSEALTEARPAEDRADGSAPALDLLAADEGLIVVERQLGTYGDTLALRRVKGEYDLVILDGGPAVTSLSANALYAADVVLVPLSLSSLAMDGVARLRELVALAEGQGHRLRVLYLPTGADARLRETRDLLDVLREAFGPYPDGDVLDPVRYSSALSRAYGMRQTIAEYAAEQHTEQNRPDPAAEQAMADYRAVLDILTNSTE